MEAVSLKKIYDYEAVRSELVSAEHSLRISLARTGHRTYARSIFFTWPNVEVASRKVAGLISHHYPNMSGDGYLLDDVLKAACGAFTATPETESFTQRMAVYLKTMVDVTASQIMYWDTHGIMGDGSTVAWQVDASPIHDWVRRKNLDRVVFTKRPSAPSVEEQGAAQIALSAHVATYNDLLHIARLRGCAKGA